MQTKPLSHFHVQRYSITKITHIVVKNKLSQALIYLSVIYVQTTSTWAVTQCTHTYVGTVSILHCRSFLTALAVLTGYRQTRKSSSRIPRRIRATKPSGNFFLQNKFVLVAMHNQCNLVYTWVLRWWGA